MGSNLGESMGLYKCIVPLRHGCTSNNHTATSPLVRFVEEKWEVFDDIQGVLPQNWDGTEPNRTVTCIVLKAMANDRRTTSPLPQ
ncbi:uncharacterized protein TNCV_2559541 [Trichonephila clavipes]|nr:uncharacterized protein TNCV_2559541 [Trichonephila clavipes]